MSGLAGAIQAERHAFETRLRPPQQRCDLGKGRAITYQAIRVGGFAHPLHNLGKVAMQGGLTAGEGQVVDAASLALSQHLVQERQRQLAGPGMALVLTVLAAQIAAIGQLDHQSGHRAAPSASRRRRTRTRGSS